MVSAAVTLCVLVYSIGQGMADGNEETPLSIYHPTYLVLTAGVTNAFLSGDLFNLYVGFEILLVASYVLLTLGGTETRIRAGTTYVVVSLLSSADLPDRARPGVRGHRHAQHGPSRRAGSTTLPDSLRLVLHGMLLSAFGIKAAVFPLSAWLPDSYPTAPAPVTAVFAGLLTKVGVYAIIRTETLLFPGGRVGDTSDGARPAHHDRRHPRRGRPVRHQAAALVHPGQPHRIHAVRRGPGHHVRALAAPSSTSSTTSPSRPRSSSSVGLVERRGGSTALDRLGGLAKLAPLLAILFFVPAMNLAGIPPFSGFLGKLGLFQAGFEAGTALAYVLIAGGAVTSLLTLYAVARVWSLAFWRNPHPDMPAPEGKPDPAAGGSPDRFGTGNGAAPALVAASALATSATFDDRTDSVRPAGDVDPVRGVEGTEGEQTEAEATHDDDDFSDAETAGPMLPRLMVLPTLVLVLLGMTLTVVAGPLFEVSAAAASDLRGRAPYLEAVFPEGIP